MTNKKTMLIRHAATLLMLMVVLPLAAQDVPLVDAQPGPTFGERPDNGLTLPTDVAVGIEGRVYVVDSGHHRVVYYSATGMPLGHFGAEGKADGELQGPVGITTRSNGDVYVADRGNKRLQVFDAEGKFENSLELLDEGEAVTPIDVAVDAKGRTLFVTANNSHRVLSFDPKGKFRSGWGGEGKEPGQFKYPATLAMNNSGNVLVVDVLNHRVQVFNTDGTPIAQFGTVGAKPGTFIRPKGIAVDNSGRIFVSDSYLGVVQAFTSTGEFIGVLGTGGEPIRFEAPTGLAFAAGRLYVSDMLAGKVLSYDVEAGQ